MTGLACAAAPTQRFLPCNRINTTSYISLTLSFAVDEFAQLIGYDGKVISISRQNFDPRGQYETVVDSVKRAGGGEAAFFRVEHGSTRAEYYIVSLDKKGGRTVGLKALAVES